MIIYESTKVLPYVYKLTHKETGQFYFGSRWANIVPSSEDLGIKYFTSSKYVKPMFYDFHIDILAEFFDYKDAYLFEQDMILENWNNPLKLNKKVHKNKEILWMCPEVSPLKGVPKSKESISKMKQTKHKNKKSAWNKGLKLTEEKYKVGGRKSKGNIRTEESKQKQSLSTRGIPKSEEHNRKNSLALSGRKFSEEHKINISLAKRGKPNGSKGKEWFNDGVREYFTKNPNLDWIKGKLDRPNNHTKNKKIYNNGIIAKFFDEGSQPNGWILGRIKSCE
jgi:hypothetical protein